MDSIDYNGKGQWSRTAILARYAEYAAQGRHAERDLSPAEHSERGRHWVYPVMNKVIDGIEAGDLACVRIGIEFIEEDAKFAFGKTLKANTARALRRATLSHDQRHRILKRVFGMLKAGVVPHEYREYAKLAKKIGFKVDDVPEVDGANPFAVRFWKYFVQAAAAAD